MGADEGGGDRESRLGACFEGAQSAYHEWVKQNLLDALQGKQAMEEKQRALKERLEKIRQWLLENPDKLNSGKYLGLL
ncbi:MAG: hypothetical protein HZLCBSQH_000480 [Candidatus Fervidibacterota bacterium]